MSIQLDHVAVSIPQGGEQQAREFYSGLLGLQEIQKPKALAQRGGVWLDLGNALLHLTASTSFQPANKAHPGLLVSNYSEIKKKLQHADIDYQDDSSWPGVTRLFTQDPFSNRIELIDATSLAERNQSTNS